MSDAPQIGPQTGPQTGSQTGAAPLTASKAMSATTSRGPNRRRTRGGRQNAGISMIEVTALVLSLGWLGLVGWYFLTLDDDQGRLIRGNPSGFMIAVLGIFLPVALIWVAASVARTAQTMREESARLQAAIDTIRLSHLDQQAADNLAELLIELNDRHQVALITVTHSAALAARMQRICELRNGTLVDRPAAQ